MISTKQTYAENIARPENAAYAIIVDELFAIGAINEKRMLLLGSKEITAAFALAAARIDSELDAKHGKNRAHSIKNAHPSLSGVLGKFFDFLAPEDKLGVVQSFGVEFIIKNGLDEVPSISRFFMERAASKDPRAARGKYMEVRIVSSGGEEQKATACFSNNGNMDVVRVQFNDTLMITDEDGFKHGSKSERFYLQEHDCAICVIVPYKAGVNNDYPNHSWRLHPDDAKKILEGGGG